MLDFGLMKDTAIYMRRNYEGMVNHVETMVCSGQQRSIARLGGKIYGIENLLKPVGRQAEKRKSLVQGG